MERRKKNVESSFEKMCKTYKKSLCTTIYGYDDGNACMDRKSTHTQARKYFSWWIYWAAYTGSTMNFDLRSIICKEKRKLWLFEFKTVK